MVLALCRRMISYWYTASLQLSTVHTADSPQLLAKHLTNTSTMTVRQTCSIPPMSFAVRAKVKETVRASLEETGADKALLVGHSAGGWLARAALAEGKWEEGVASQDVVAGVKRLPVPL